MLAGVEKYTLPGIKIVKKIMLEEITRLNRLCYSDIRFTLVVGECDGQEQVSYKLIMGFYNVK